MEISLNLKNESERRTEQFVPEGPLSFGQLRTDHMFIAEYKGGEWQDARIVPYQNFSIAPGAIVLHYSQEVFEGAKAFLHDDGEIYTCRFEKNAQRMNRSSAVVCMPEIPVEMQMEAVEALIDVDRLWCPVQDGASMYIRPFVFGTQDMLGVKPSDSYIFSVILSPSGPYYPKGFSEPVKLLITDRFHRAAPGGTGASKTGGNYAASMRAGEYAYSKGANQVLYLDTTNTYIEECGAMNHFHVMKDGTVVIPEFTDTILRSITSESVMELAPELGIKVVQEKVRIDDFIKGVENGDIVEAGGFGTAAVISAVGTYLFEDGREITVGDGQIGPVSRKIYDAYTGIQRGLREDSLNWLRKVDRRFVYDL
ncbi:branched-chain amino acid aminotransferase [Limisalsivibrio acetivorans]|uniref:branched-chain amino acid aminotransferase n=1 Tax=Limisalsivibrio acetivorans TaxID=1304888 RepID=UPI0003B6C9EF|nr:branched-chain amino acid aminotransferase [Limisalsivibrio acetivorans]